MLTNPLKTPVLNKLTSIAAIIRNGIVLKIENTALNNFGIILNLNSTLVKIGKSNKAVNNAKIDENNAIFIVSIIGCFNSPKIEKSTGYIRPNKFCILLKPTEKVFASYCIYAIKKIHTINMLANILFIYFLIIKFFKFIFSHHIRIFIK